MSWAISSRTEVGMPFRKLYLFCHTLELSFTDSCQVFPVGGRSGLFVQDNGKIVTASNLLAHFFGEGNGFFHRHPPDGNKRHYIYSTHTRVLPLMVIEIYQLYRCADSFEHGITKRFRFAHYGHHEAVMVFIVAVIQQFHTLFAPKRSHYLIYLLQIASFTEIGDAFHNLIHNAL